MLTEEWDLHCTKAGPWTLTTDSAEHDVPTVTQLASKRYDNEETRSHIWGTADQGKESGRTQSTKNHGKEQAGHSQDAGLRPGARHSCTSSGWASVKQAGALPHSNNGTTKVRGQVIFPGPPAWAKAKPGSTLRSDANTQALLTSCFCLLEEQANE